MTQQADPELSYDNDGNIIGAAEPPTTARGRGRPGGSPPPQPAKSDFEKLQELPYIPQEYKPFQSDEPYKLTPEMVLQFFAKPTREGHWPSHSDAVRFCMLCESRKLDPRQGDAFIVGYDTKDGPVFNCITAHQAFLKRAEACPDYDGMESGVLVFDKVTDTYQELAGDFVPTEFDLVGGWAKVHRKDRKFPTYRKPDLKTFKKPYGQWLTNTAGMIVKCAEADALRSSFPNSIGGMYIDGEMIAPEGQQGGATKNSRLDETKKAIEEAKGGNGQAAPPAPQPAAPPPAQPAAGRRPKAKPDQPPPTPQTAPNASPDSLLPPPPAPPAPTGQPDRENPPRTPRSRPTTRPQAPAPTAAPVAPAGQPASTPAGQIQPAAPSRKKFNPEMELAVKESLEKPLTDIVRYLEGLRDNNPKLLNQAKVDANLKKSIGEMTDDQIREVYALARHAIMTVPPAK